MLVIFTYLRPDCPCDVTTFLDLTSFRLLTGSGQRVKSRVGSRVKNPDPVPPVVDVIYICNSLSIDVVNSSCHRDVNFNSHLGHVTDVSYS